MGEIIESEEFSLEKQEQARDMYFAGIYPSEISDELNVGFDLLGTYVFGMDGTGNDPKCWSYQLKERRNMGTVALTGSYVRQKPHILKQAEAGMIKLVQDSVKAHNNDGKILEVNEINTVIAAVEKIDRITRLEEGKATEHKALEVKHFDQRQVMEHARKNSPSAHPDVEAEFKKLAERQGTDFNDKNSDKD